MATKTPFTREESNPFEEFINKIKVGFCDVHKSTLKEQEDDVLETMKNREISIAEPPLGDVAGLKDEEEETLVEKEDEEEVEVAVMVDSEPRRKQPVKQHDMETNLCILLVILLSFLTMYQHGYRLDLLSGSRAPVASLEDVHETVEPSIVDTVPLAIAPAPEMAEPAEAKTQKGQRKSRPLITEKSEQTKLVKTKTSDKKQKAQAGAKSIVDKQNPSPSQTNQEL